jgi:hypothetical protein
MEELLRGDSTARAAFLSTMVDHGIYTPNKARAYEDQEPMDGGDHLIVNGTMQRLDQIGQAPQANTPANTKSAPSSAV